MWSSELHLSLPYESTCDKNSLFLLTWIILDHPDVERLENFLYGIKYSTTPKIFSFSKKIKNFWSVFESHQETVQKFRPKISAFSQKILQISAPKYT